MPNETDVIPWAPPKSTGPLAPGDYAVAGGGVIPAGVVDFHGGSVQAVYDYYNSLDPDMWDDWWAYETAEAERLATETAGWQEGKGTIESLIDAVMVDPNFEAAMASLTEMMSPDYDAIGEAELAGLQRELGGGVNRAQSDRAAALRRAGLSGSGMDIENAPLYTAIGSAALGDLNAAVDIANEETRREATTQAGQMSLAQQGLRAPLDLALAGLQANPPTSGYDPLLGLSLDTWLDQQEEATRQYEETMAAVDEAMAAYEESQPGAWLPDPIEGAVNALMDILNAGLPFLGTGIPRTVLP